ncbi:BTB/POZ domain [Trinorchestia longiramus]|nr:BTB/POZ domain [Trinorchestia longiramus]
MFPQYSPVMASGGIRMAMSPQQFCLRWNNHQSNFVSVFEQLLHTEQFVDVTIAVEGRTLKAHKMVLSACSPYFQAVLASHPDKHPIVILKDVRYTDMRDLLDFMYRGEASVDQENLPTFLRVAECLRIKGLTEVGDKRGESIPSPYLIQQGLSTSNSTNVSNGSIAIAPPSILPGAPLTPLPGDPPPLKRPPLSPTTTGAKRRRGRPPKISGEDSETDVGISHDEESRSGSVSGVSASGAPIPGNVGVETEIKTESDDPMDHKDSDGSRPPSHQAEETKAGPSGESVAKDLSKSSTEDSESTRQSPGSAVPHHSEASWHPPMPEYDPDDSSSLSGITSHPSPLALVAPIPKHPSPVTDIDQLYYTKNLLEAAIRKNPYDALKGDNNLHGSILLASLRSPLKFGPFQGVYGGERDVLDREYMDTSPHSPHASPQKPSQSTSLHSPGSLASSAHGVPKSSYGSSSSNGNANIPNSHSNTNSKSVSVPIMSYCIQDNGFKCSKCFQTFTHPSNFHRHYITVHTDRRNHKCTVCGKEFKRKDNMMSHMRSVHRPGREGHAIFRDVTSVSPSSLSCDINSIKLEKVQPPMIGQ